MSSSKTSKSLEVLEDKVLANLLDRAFPDSIRKFKDQTTFLKDIYNVPLRREQILETAVYTISKIDNKISRPTSRIEGRSENSTISTDQRELIAEIDKNLKRLNDQKRFLQMARDCRPDRTWGECLSANKSLRKSNRSRSASEKTPRRCDLDKHHVCEVLQKLFEQNCIKIADSGTQVGTSIGHRRARDECLHDQRPKNRSKSARNKRNFAQNVCLWNEFADKRECQERERNSPRIVPIRMVSSGTQVGMCAKSSKRYSNKNRYGRRTSSESNISRGKFDITTCEASECASGTSLECRSRFPKKCKLGSDKYFNKFRTTYVSTYKPRKGETCAPEKDDRQKEQSRIEKEVKTRVIYTRSPGKVPIFTSDEQSSIREPRSKKRDKKTCGSYHDPYYMDSIERDLNRMPFKPVRLCDEIKDYTHQKVVHCDTKNYNKSNLQSPRKHSRPDGHVSFRSRTKTVRSRQVRVNPTNADGEANQRPLYRISEHRIKIKESRERVGRSSGRDMGKLQADRDKVRCQTNNLSAASSSTRLRNLCSVKPNVVEDYSCICPESDENKNYLILPYDPNCTKVTQPPCSHMKCTHCLQDFFPVEDHEKCARIREKSAVILEDISSRESRVYTDSYHLQDSSLITALPSSPFEPRRSPPIPVPFLLQADDFQKVPQVRSASDIDTIYRPLEFKRSSVRDGLRQSLISKSDSQVRSPPDIDPMFRGAERFSEPEAATAHKLDYKPRQSTRFSLYPPELSAEYERQSSAAAPRESMYDKRESRRSLVAPWEFYEEKEISPRRSPALPRDSMYEKERLEFSPRKSSAMPRGSSYEKRESEFRRSSAAPRESQFEDREAVFSPRRSSAMPRDSMYDKRESEFRRSTSASRVSVIEERKSSPRRSSAFPRESYYEGRKSSVVPRDYSYEKRKSEPIPTRSSAFPRDSMYEKETAEFSPRRSSTMPRGSSYAKRGSDFGKSSTAPRDAHIEQLKSNARRRSTLPRESLYEEGETIPGRRSTAKPQDSVQEKSESDSGPRTSSAKPRESAYDKRESELRKGTAAPRESQYVEEKSSPRFSALLREAQYEENESNPVRQTSVVPHDSAYDKRKSDSSQRKSSVMPQESKFDDTELVFIRCPAEQGGSQFEERKSNPRKSSALPRESLYEEGESSQLRRSSAKPRGSVQEKSESDSGQRRSSAKPRESVSDKRESEFRRSPTRTREFQFEELQSSPRRISAVPIEEELGATRKSSTKPKESASDKRGSEPRKGPKVPRELQFEEGSSRRISAVPIESAYDAEEPSTARSSAKPRESVQEKRDSEFRKSSPVHRESQYQEPEFIPPAPRESQYEKRKSSPRRSSAMPWDSAYGKLESEPIPRRSSAAPQESSYEKSESSTRRRSAAPRQSTYKEPVLEQSISSEVTQKTPFERRGSSPRRSSATPRESVREKQESSARRSSAVPRETLTEEREFNPRRSSARPRKSHQYEEPKPRRSIAPAQESQSDKDVSTKKTISAVLRESVYKWRESELRTTKTIQKFESDTQESKPRKSSVMPVESSYEEPGSSQRKSAIVPQELTYKKPELSPRRSSSTPRQSVYEKQESSSRRSSAIPRESLHDKRDSGFKRSPAAPQGMLSDEQRSSPRERMALSRGAHKNRHSSPIRSSATPRESAYGERKSSSRRNSAAPRESLYQEQVMERNTSSEVPQDTPFERKESTPRRSSAAPQEYAYGERKSSPGRSSAAPQDSVYGERISSPRKSSAVPRESSYKEQILEQSSSEVPQETPHERRGTSSRRSSAGLREFEPRMSSVTHESDPHQSTDLELEQQDSKPRLSLVKKRVAQFENYHPKIRNSLIPVHHDKREAEPRGSSAPPHHKRGSEARRSSSPIRNSMFEQRESKPGSFISPRQALEKREQESFTSSMSPRQSFDDKRLSESRRISKPNRGSEFEPRRSSVSPRQSYTEKQFSESRKSSIPVRDSLKERRESEPRRSSMSPRQSSEERRVSESRSSTPMKERRDSEMRKSVISPRDSFADRRISSARKSPSSSYKLTDVIRRESGSISPRWAPIKPQNAKLEKANKFIGLESPGITSMSSQEYFVRETKTECFAIAESEVICPPAPCCDATETMSSSSPSPEVTCPCPCPSPVSPCSNGSNEIFTCNVGMTTPTLGTITCGEAICKRIDSCCDRVLAPSRSLSPPVGHWYNFAVNDIKSDSDQGQQKRSTHHMISAIARESEERRVSRQRSTTNTTRSRSFTELQTESFNHDVELRLSKTEDNLSTTSMEDQPVKSIHLKANVRQPPPKEVKIGSPSFRPSDIPTTSPQSQSNSESFYSEVYDKSRYIKEVDSELQNFMHYLQGRLKDCDDMVKRQLHNIEECTNRGSNQSSKIESSPPTETDAADDLISTQLRPSVIVDLGAADDCTSSQNQLVPIEDLTLPLDSSRMSGSDDGSCHCSRCEEGSSDSSEIPPFTGCECMREDYYKIMELAYQKKRKK